MFLVKKSPYRGLGLCFSNKTAARTLSLKTVQQNQFKDRLLASKLSVRYNVLGRACSTALLPEIQKIRPDLKTHEELYRFSIDEVGMYNTTIFL
jgi:hypothetical protein